MSVAGIVLARGSSKSIEHKNIRLLNGKPLLGWVLESMKCSNVFKDIWVSTDDQTIANVAQSFGAKVFYRSNLYSKDDSSSIDAVREFLQSQQDIERICLVQCTSPCLHPNFLEEGLRKFDSLENCSVFSVYLSHSLRWSLDLVPLNLDPQNRTRRQDWKGEYVESGHFYFTTRRLIATTNSLQGGQRLIVQIPSHLCIELDNPEQWPIAEVVVKHYGFNLEQTNIK